MLVATNWGNFRAKFNGAEQKTFEWMASLFFYREHNHPLGAARYFNQAGIEAEPIRIGDEVIGWQAKFTDRELASYKDQLITAITTAKDQHPALTQIYFYINADFGQGRKAKDPKYKTDIEAHAVTKGVSVTWKTAAFFESPFVCEAHAAISSHFFNLEPSIFNLVQQVAEHGAGILSPIQSQISVDGRTMKIDRSKVVEELQQTLGRSSLVILSGDGGVGKTAVVKDLQSQMKDQEPFFVFKASEFNIKNVNELFTYYGALSLSQFISAHSDFAEKYVVIDSAEKLADIKNPDAFREFLGTLRRSGWKVIFTTRLGYLEDLKYELIELYGATFEPINVPSLSSTELAEIASKNSFLLPTNERLRSLLKNLFYLKEYLRTYPEGNGAAEYSKFREALWNNQIERASVRLGNIHRRRGECLVQIAQRRAAGGLFYATILGYDDALAQLEADEVIKFDPNAQGYFITHDIYEEWALERLVEQSYRGSRRHSDLYDTLGDSLPVRRAFRSWLGEKLLSETDEALQLIVSTIEESSISRHWKDEAIVAALLSDQSHLLVQRFGRSMLEQLRASDIQATLTRTNPPSGAPLSEESPLFHQMLFLLRVACKEVDQDALRGYGGDEELQVRMSAFFTKPKGAGWSAVIEFIYRNSAEASLRFVNLVLPILEDWTNHHKAGATTRFSGLIALHMLQKLAREEVNHRRSRNDRAKITTILFNSSREIKSELASVFESVIELGDSDYEGPYNDLAKRALSSIDKSAIVATHLPKQVLGLASVFWHEEHYEPSHRAFGYRNDLEHHFNLPSKSVSEYYASAFRTPVFALLQSAPHTTLDFILKFVNEAAENYSTSSLDEGVVEQVELTVLQSDVPVKQFISTRLWQMYRGGMPAPSLLQSMHMALERWLLQIVKNATADVAESWCLYLLRNSRSASITAVVASVVHAEPNKLANVVYVLLRSRAVIEFDLSRKNFEHRAKSLYSMALPQDRFFAEERVATCSEKHRQNSLEDIALKFQLFRSESDSDTEAHARQDAVWRILDVHYAKLEELPAGVPESKTWRLSLARMDRRRMTISSEANDHGIQLSFAPDLEDDLREYSDSSQAKLTNSMRYTSLFLWSHNRWDGDKASYSKYPQYEENPKQVAAATRAVYDALLSGSDDDEYVQLSMRSIPPTACAVLVRDFSSALDLEDLEFCKEVLLLYSCIPFKEDYQYQIGDGFSAAIKALPSLLATFTDDIDYVKLILLLTLLDENPVGTNERFSSFAVEAVSTLAKTHPDAVDALFAGYLYLSPIWKNLCDKAVREMHTAHAYGIRHFNLVQRLLQDYEAAVEIAYQGNVSFDQLPALDSLAPIVLATGFELLRLRTDNAQHKDFARKAAVVVIEGSQRRTHRNERFDFGERLRFYEKFAQVVLHAETKDIPQYMQPFLERFSDVEDADHLIQEFIAAEDRFHQYEAFWTVWELLYPVIVRVCHQGGHSSNTVHNYLLAWPYWPKNAKQWHSLKEREKSFFAKAAREIGEHPSVLYSLAKLLNEVGTPFVGDGIFWISGIIERSPSLISEELERDTEYYLENLVRGYVLRNRDLIRRTLHIKHAVLRTLNFLLERGSVTAYLTREHIL